jgi:cytoskeletal protein CcmA (bactofilin family)
MGMSVSGQIQSSGPLHVEGHLDGSVVCDSLSIGPTGRIAGEVTAVNLRIEGQLEGEITAEALEMGPTASMEGKLLCQTLELAFGATLSGEIKVG